MPTLTFDIDQDKYDQISNCMETWNTFHPEDPVTDANELAKRCYQKHADLLLDRYCKNRVKDFATQIATCDKITWAKVAKVLIPTLTEVEVSKIEGTYIEPVEIIEKVVEEPLKEPVETPIGG